MMKTLYLVRHAKSSWAHDELTDFERPLNDRGKHDAPLMGEGLAARNILPDLIIASTAKRALKTAKFISKAIGYDKAKIEESNALYLAEPKDLIDIISGIDDSVNSAMLFGHNPGFTNLANALSDIKIDNMPTCSIFCIEFTVKSWKEVRTTQGKYKFFDYPKKAF